MTKKLQCKYCNHRAEKLSDLRSHFNQAHTVEAKLLRMQLREYDAQHEHELSKECTICSHRNRRGQTGYGTAD